MKEMLSVLRTSGIFSGISEEETEKMLHCLEVRPETFQKDEYILRAGDRVEAFGLVITGKVLIIQEDFWETGIFLLQWERDIVLQKPLPVPRVLY